MRLDSTQARGFTLIELMTTVAIAAIFIAIAVPSFRTYQANQQVRSAADDLTFALNFARSEAVKRRTNVTVAPATANTWQGGWTVAHGTTTLKTYAALAGLTISTPAANPVYNSDGRSTSAATLQFNIVPTSAPSAGSRCVSIAPSGKPSNNVGGC